MDERPLVSIVDDDPSVRKALARLCTVAGYRVDLFDSSESFLDAGVAYRTDCLILDLHLPGKSGLELQEELVAAHKHCPIVFITAYGDEHARRQAIKGGAIGFFGKPLDVKRLLKVIGDAVSER